MRFFINMWCSFGAPKGVVKGLSVQHRHRAHRLLGVVKQNVVSVYFGVKCLHSFPLVLRLRQVPIRKRAAHHLFSLNPLQKNLLNKNLVGSGCYELS